MSLKEIQIVLDNSGGVIDKSYTPIISNSNYTYKLQIISPALQTSAVDVTISTYNSQIEKKTIRLRLAKDSNGNYLKGRDVIDERRKYFDDVADYNVWEIEIQGTILSILQKTNASKILIGAAIYEMINDPNATNYLGTFGNFSETVLDIPTPTTESEGDYYECNSLNFHSNNLNIDFKYKDIVIFDGFNWVKGLRFRLSYPITPVELVVDPSLIAVYDDIEPTLTEDIVSAISELDGLSQANQNNIRFNTEDIDTLKYEITNKEDKLPTKSSTDAGKYVKINETGDGYIYEDVPISTIEIQDDILSLRDRVSVNESDIDTLESDVLNLNNNTYTKEEVYDKTETDNLLLNKSDDGHVHIEADITDLDKYTQSEVDTLLDNYILNTEKGSTIAELDTNGKVPLSQTYDSLEDVLEYTSVDLFPETGLSGTFYVDTSTNLVYRWSGTQYVVTTSSLALGETIDTAYRGDRGKIAYDHTLDNENPHNVDKFQVDLGNVDNTSDVDKPISTATQNALDLKVDESIYNQHITDFNNHLTDIENELHEPTYYEETYSGEVNRPQIAMKYSAHKLTKLQGKTRETVNLIQGFNSSDWSFHSNVIINSDNKITLNADSTYQTSRISVGALQNRNYSWSINHNAYIIIEAYDINDNKISNIVNYSIAQSGNIVTPSGTVRIDLVLSNSSIGAGTYTFENVMLNEGSTALPYEPYFAGLKPVENPLVKVVGKNLIPKLVVGGLDSLGRIDEYTDRYITPDFIPIRYLDTISVSSNLSGDATCYYDENFNFIDRAFYGGSFSRQVPFENAKYVRFEFLQDVSLNDAWVQMEYGTSPTSYEPYQEHTTQLLGTFNEWDSYEDGINKKGSTDVINLWELAWVKNIDYVNYTRFIVYGFNDDYGTYDNKTYIKVNGGWYPETTAGMEDRTVQIASGGILHMNIETSIINDIMTRDSVNEETAFITYLQEKNVQGTFKTATVTEEPLVPTNEDIAFDEHSTIYIESNTPSIPSVTFNCMIDVASQTKYLTDSALKQQRELDNHEERIVDIEEDVLNPLEVVETYNERINETNLSNGVGILKELRGETIETVNLFDNSDLAQGTITTAGDSPNGDLTRVGINLTLLTSQNYTISNFTGYDIFIRTKNSDSVWINSDPYTFTPDDNVVSLIFRKTDNSNITVGEIQALNIMLNEGTTPLPYQPYFSGLKSVVNPTVKVVNENLIDNNKLLKDTSIAWANGVASQELNSTTTDYIKVNINTTYSTNYGCQVLFYDYNKNYLYYLDQVSHSSFTVPNDNAIVYVRLGYRSLYNNNLIMYEQNIMLNKGTSPLPYIPHQSTQAQFLGTFRQWDSLKIVNGVYKKENGSVEVNLWEYSTIVYISDFDSINYYAFYFNDFIINENIIGEGGGSKVNTFDYLNVTDFIPADNRLYSFSASSNRMFIKVEKTLIDAQTGATLEDKLKAYLQANNIQFVGQKATTTLEDVEMDGDAQHNIDTEKTIYLESDEPVLPSVDVEYAVSQKSQILQNVEIDKRQQKDIDKIEDDINTINSNINTKMNSDDILFSFSDGILTITDNT